ncbi:MAG: hypothetical protein OXT72_14045 [Gammaproteobacteria bacterium]|nr:hypothetical protein [Gammaproteobacteria bacterium]MDE0247918.1 hypothetical protein [Gammaproteobacteria bacterium]
MRSVFLAWAVGGLLLASAPAAVQGQVMYRSGQSVQPVFEGREENPDGSYTMWFGYLNRNYEEQPHIPLGPDNYFSVVDADGAGQGAVAGEGVIDRGQPTHFYPRRQAFVFGVTVPEDFGDRELVWTLRRDGEVRTAVAKLEPAWVWNLNADIWRGNRGGIRSDAPNQPPTIRIVGETATVPVGEPVLLTVSVEDDGIPEPQEAAGPRRAPPAPPPNDLPFITGVAGEPVRQAVVSAAAARATGMAVTWLHYRGPGSVTFDRMVIPLDAAGGTATTSARFGEPGTYEIRAYADDGLYPRSAGVTVIVTGSSAERR